MTREFPPEPIAPEQLAEPDTLPPPPDPLPGTTIGQRYFVERPLGQGGMGVVYAGRHEELHRPVAIKVLMPMWSTQREAVERFFREARTASSVGHPNIVDVYDLGRLPDQRPYLVMPLLDGMDLNSYLQAYGPQSEKRVVELLAGVASALDLMHTKGLVHRDIKPENMMLVQREDGEETVKLLDFGLAALMHSASRITQQGAIFGTAHYMSPEAATGEMPDARGDVYSLATVAFALLTGKLPFDAEHPMRVLTEKLSKEAIRLNEVSERVFSTAVERAIAKSLALDPEDRHASCRELIDALRDACVEAPRGGTERILLPPTDVPTDMPSVAPAAVQPDVSSTSASLGGDGDSEGASRGLKWAAAFLVLVAIGAVAGWAVHTNSASEVHAEAQESPVEANTTAPVLPTNLPQDNGEVESVEEPVVAPPLPTPEPEVVGAMSQSAMTQTTMSESAMSQSAMSQTTMSESATSEDPDPEGAPAADPERAARLTREGTTAFAQGRLPEAVNLFRTATQVAPRYGAAWRGLGLANERFGRQREALRAYRRYLRVAPGAADAPAIRARAAALEAED